MISRILFIYNNDFEYHIELFKASLFLMCIGLVLHFIGGFIIPLILASSLIKIALLLTIIASSLSVIGSISQIIKTRKISNFINVFCWLCLIYFLISII